MVETSPPSKHTRWMWLIWLMIPLLLWWALRQAPLQTVWGLFSNFSFVAIGLLLLVRAAIILVLSSRWRWFLAALGYPLKPLTIAGYHLTGFSISYFTPGPQWGGEPVQVYLVKHRHSVPTADSVAAVTLDKLLALLSQGMVMLLGFGVILGAGLGGRFAWQSLAIVLGLVALPLAYLIMLWRDSRPFTYLLQLLPDRLNLGAGAVISEAEAHMGDFCRNQTTVFWQGVFLSFVIWPLLLSLEFWLALHFLKVPANMSQILIVLATSRVAMAMPFPAGLGALEVSQVLAMQLLQADPAIGVALSLLIRARDLLMGGLGLAWGAFLWQGRKRIIINDGHADELTRMNCGPN